VTKVRGVLWTACAIAAGAWAGAVVAGRRTAAVVAPSIVETSAPAPETAAVAPASEPTSATLVVHLRSDATGDPVETTVWLWRLGQPETDVWTPGDDEEVRPLIVDADGASLPGLPAGRYRLQVLDVRHDADDPPAFDVAAGQTVERTFEIADRRVVRTRTMLARPDGTPLARCVRQPIQRSDGSSRGEGAPRWARPRRQTSPTNGDHHSYGAGLIVGCGFGGKPETIDADADSCFDAATHRERGRSGYRIWSDAYRVDGCNEVERAADDKIGVDTTFVGVVAPTTTLVAHVVRPDGTRVDPSHAVVTAHCAAVRCAWTPPADAWRTVPVHVKVTVPFLSPLEFDWTAATADAEHRLAASPPKSPK
jgi:hypothetical protein